jgi:hypothetical protein
MQRANFTALVLIRFAPIVEVKNRGTMADEISASARNNHESKNFEAG